MTHLFGIKNMATLQEIIDYSKENPNTDYAKQAFENLKSGNWDTKAEKEGVDISRFKRTKAQREKDARLQQEAELARAEEKKGFLERVGERFTERKEEIGRIGERVEEDVISEPSAILQTTGQFAGGAGDVVGEAIVSGFRALPESVKGGLQTAGAKLAETEKGQELITSLQNISGGFQAFEQENPELAGNLKAVFNIGEFALDFLGLGIGAKGAKVGTKVIKEVGEEVVEKGVRVAGEVVEKAGEKIAKRRALKVEKAGQEIEDIVGRIVQGKPKDIPKATRALVDIDTKDVTTFAGLKEATVDKSKALVSKLDEFLEKQKGIFKSDDLITTTKVGQREVRQNFVEDAIEQLDELYTKTKDATSLAKVRNLKDKLVTEGLGVKEINDLAREYGRELSQKGFSKVTGDPLTSVNAQAFENTRKGIKETARSKIEGKLPQQIDSRISSLIDTERLVGKMEEKVNSLFQKVKKRGILERAARKVADIIDVATFKTASGFISRMLPSNVGLKTMNALDIQEELAKNIKKLDRLLEGGVPEDKIIDTIDDIIRAGQASAK
jgi:hypothetical protein